MQLDTLWKFMQVDMEADNFEAKVRQSPVRQKLIKQRDFLKDQQTNMKKLENDVSIMQDRLAAVQDEAARLEKTLSALNADLKANPPKTQEEAEKAIENVAKLADTLSRYETELQKMRKDAEAKDRQQKEIRVHAAKAKLEYDTLKEQYEKEHGEATAAVAKQRAKVEEAAKKVDGALLEEYKTVKQHIAPPMAKLIEGQCTGCFMSLPSATLLAIKSGAKIVKCDNCGRILFYQE